MNNEQNEALLNAVIMETAGTMIQNLLIKNIELIEQGMRNSNNSVDIKIDLKLNAKKGKLFLATGIGFPVKKIKDKETFEIDLGQLELPFK